LDLEAMSRLTDETVLICHPEIAVAFLTAELMTEVLCVQRYG